MQFTSEQIKKAKTAKSAEELLAMAKENNVAMSEDEAKYLFAELNKEGELTDDELVAVAGGGKWDEPEEVLPKPKFKAGDRVRMRPGDCSDLVVGTVQSVDYFLSENMGYMYTINWDTCDSFQYPEYRLEPYC